MMEAERGALSVRERDIYIIIEYIGEKINQNTQT